MGLMENTMPSRTSFLPDALISVLSEPASLRAAASARRWQAENKNTRLMPWVTRPHQKAGASPPLHQEEESTSLEANQNPNWVPWWSWDDEVRRASAGKTKAMLKFMNFRPQKRCFHSHLQSKVVSWLAMRHKNSFQPRWTPSLTLLAESAVLRENTRPRRVCF